MINIEYQRAMLMSFCNIYLCPFEDRNWNDLVKIVEKIESIRDEKYGWFCVNIYKNICSIYSQHLCDVVQGSDELAYMSDTNLVFDNKFDSTLAVLISFVEWYNNYLDDTNKNK